MKKIVRNLWDEGDPATRMKVNDELRVREDCQLGTPFYDNHLTSTITAQVILANFIYRLLNVCVLV